MNKLVENFLKENDNKQLYENYLKYPSDSKEKHLQIEFNEFYLQIRLLSYFSKSLHFLAQNFDKKIRDRNNQMFLVLVDSDEGMSLAKLPDEESLHHEFSFDLERVEDYFEHEIIYNVVTKLTLKQKQIVYLCYVKNMSDKEISNVLNISVQTINKQRNVILTKIKRRFEIWK